MKKQKIVFPYALIGILILAAFIFSPALQNEFVNWDDRVYVTENQVITKIPFTNLPEIFAEKINSFNVPLTLLSFQIEYYFFELNPKIYHFDNIILHLLNIVLVFYFFKKLSQNQNLSLIITLLFALHPMNVESVAWVTERKDLLYTAFMLGSLLAYQKFDSEKTKKYYFIAILLFISSLLAKPQALFFPFLLVLVDFWNKKKWYDFRIWLNKIPFFLVSFVFGLHLLQSVGTSVSPLHAQFSFLDRALFSAYQLGLYVWKFFLPINLSAAYPFPEKQAGWYAWEIYAVPFVLLGILGLLWRFFSNKKVLFFGLLFYASNIFIVLHLVTINSFVAFDRFNYVAYLGFFLILAHFLLPFFEKNYNYGLLFGVYLLFLSILTYQRCQIWKNDETLFSDVIRKDRKNSLAYNNRGNYYAEKQAYQQAIEDYNATLSFAKNNGTAYFLRGFAYFQLQNYSVALQDFLKAIEQKQQLEPKNYLQALHNTGSCYYNLKQYETALPYYTKAIELSPEHQPSYAFRGNLYAHFKQYDAALQDYQTALKLNPNDALTYHQLQGLQRMLSQK